MSARVSGRRLSLSIGMAVAAAILAHPASLRADPGPHSALTSPPRPAVLPPLAAPAPAASPDALGDDFTRRPLFAPGKRLAVSGAVRGERPPARPFPVSAALFGLGGALVALGALSVLREWQRLKSGDRQPCDAATR